MDVPWHLIWRRLDSNPPNIASTELGNALQTMRALGLLSQAEPARCLPCSECSGGRFLPVEFVRDDVGQTTHGYIACPECGLTEVNTVQLERWRIDPLALLVVTVQSILPSCQPTELVAGKLWRVGRIKLAGHPREILFAAGYRPRTGSSVVASLRTRTKTILLMPSELGVTHWSNSTGNLVLALESFTLPNDGGIALDVEALEDRVAGFFGKQTPKPKAKRRSSRLADIAALERELTEHLRAARDQAVVTQDLTGSPKLLPRPSKEELGKRAKVTPSSVTRCFQDDKGEKLRLMWELAADIDRILAYRSN